MGRDVQVERKGSENRHIGSRRGVPPFHLTGVFWVKRLSGMVDTVLFPCTVVGCDREFRPDSPT
jgi:hypothetical protein